MNAFKSDLLFVATKRLRQALATDGTRDPRQWDDIIHDALGRVADAIQSEVQNAEQTAKSVGAINPDFQNVPITERRIEKTRVQMIQLGEQIHELRTEIRQAHELPPLDRVQLQMRCEEIADTIEKARTAEDEFVLDTVNSNPGSGE